MMRRRTPFRPLIPSLDQYLESERKEFEKQSEHLYTWLPFVPQQGTFTWIQSEDLYTPTIKLTAYCHANLSPIPNSSKIGDLPVDVKQAADWLSKKSCDWASLAESEESLYPTCSVEAIALVKPLPRSRIQSASTSMVRVAHRQEAAQTHNTLGSCERIEHTNPPHHSSTGQGSAQHPQFA